MARTRTAEDFVADVRKRANMERTNFVTDEEILEYVNQELAELHARIVRNEGQPHFRSSTTVSVTSATSLYNLPADFWELLEITASIGGLERALSPFMANERAALLNSNTINGTMYRIQGSQIEFLPASTFTATLKYIPACVRLELGQLPTADTFDGFNGYEVAAIYGAVATCLAKEETDPSFYTALKERILKHIDAQVPHRDAANPERVTDVIGLDNALLPFG